MAIRESSLSKGHQRKLTALRKSLGKEIADRAFQEWQKQQASATSSITNDPVAIKLRRALRSLVTDKSINLGNNGYSVRRAKGKGARGFVVERIEKAQTAKKKTVGRKAKRKAVKRRAKKAPAAPASA